MIKRWHMDEHSVGYLEDNPPIPDTFHNKADLADFLAAVKRAAKKTGVKPSWLRTWLVTDLSKLTYKEPEVG